MNETFGDDPTVRKWIMEMVFPKAISSYLCISGESYHTPTSIHSKLKTNIDWICSNVKLNGEKKVIFDEQKTIYHSIKERNWARWHDGRTVGQDKENNFICKMLIQRIEKLINEYISEWLSKTPYPSDLKDDKDIFSIVKQVDEQTESDDDDDDDDDDEEELTQQENADTWTTPDGVTYDLEYGELYDQETGEKVADISDTKGWIVRKEAIKIHAANIAKKMEGNI